MATQAVEPANSVEVCKVLQNSMALAASRPRVELSQHCKGAPDNKASAMETRLRLEHKGVIISHAAPHLAVH